MARPNCILQDCAAQIPPAAMRSWTCQRNMHPRGRKGAAFEQGIKSPYWKPDKGRFAIHPDALQGTKNLVSSDIYNRSLNGCNSNGNDFFRSEFLLSHSLYICFFVMTDTPSDPSTATGGSQRVSHTHSIVKTRVEQLTICPSTG